MLEARVFRRAGRGKSAPPVRRGEGHLSVPSYSTGSVCGSFDGGTASRIDRSAIPERLVEPHQLTPELVVTG